MQSVAVSRRAEADPVAVRVSEDPERRGVLVADQRAARRQRGVKAWLHLSRVDPDIEVPALSGLVAAGWLEPQQWQRSIGVFDIGQARTGYVLGVEHGGPERTELGVVRGVQGELDQADAPALQLRTGLRGDRRNPAGQRDVPVGHATGVMATEAYVHAGVAQVQIGVVVHLLRGRPNRVDDLQAGGEVRRVDAGLEGTGAVMDEMGPTVEPGLGDLLGVQRVGTHRPILARPADRRHLSRPPVRPLRAQRARR